MRWFWIKEGGDFVCEGSLLTQIRMGDIDKKINDLFFFVVNFYINPLNPIILRYKKWELLLLPRENINNLFRNLSREGGYAFTYKGHTRYNGGAFYTPKEVEFLLDPLRIFLSFVRGAWCNIFFLEGRANDNPIVAIHQNPLLPPKISA